MVLDGRNAGRKTTRKGWPAKIPRQRPQLEIFQLGPQQKLWLAVTPTGSQALQLDLTPQGGQGNWLAQLALAGKILKTGAERTKRDPVELTPEPVQLGRGVSTVEGPISLALDVSQDQLTLGIAQIGVA